MIKWKKNFLDHTVPSYSYRPNTFCFIYFYDHHLPSHRPHFSRQWQKWDEKKSQELFILLCGPFFLISFIPSQIYSPQLFSISFLLFHFILYFQGWFFKASSKMTCPPNQSWNGSDENRWTPLKFNFKPHRAKHIETVPLDIPKNVNRVVLFTVLDSYVCF